ncbi:MAG: hypothetical protein ACFB9M_17255 [Myxococcota bacterium]
MSQGRRLQNYLLDRRFQLKYASMVVALSGLLSVGFGAFVVHQSRVHSRMLRLEAEFDPVLHEALTRSDSRFVTVLILGLILFNLVLFLGSIVITHRIAGPIFVFERVMRHVAEGRIPTSRSLRRGDEFKQMHRALGQMLVVLRRQTEDDLALLVQAQSEIPQGNQVWSAIDQAREEKVRSLEPPDPRES